MTANRSPLSAALFLSLFALATCRARGYEFPESDELDDLFAGQSASYESPADGGTILDGASKRSVPVTYRVVKDQELATLSKQRALYFDPNERYGDDEEQEEDDDEGDVAPAPSPKKTTEATANRDKEEPRILKGFGLGAGKLG